jgi:hypothetical protein
MYGEQSVFRSLHFHSYSAHFRVSWDMKVHYCVHKISQLIRTLIKMNPVSVTPLYSLNYILILYSDLRLCL